MCFLVCSPILCSTRPCTSLYPVRLASTETYPAHPQNNLNLTAMPLFSKKAPEPKRQTLVIAGLTVNVYSQPKATKPDAPVAIAFLLHGRNGTALRMEEFVNGLFDEVHARRTKHKDDAQDLYIVTLVSVMFEAHPYEAVWLIAGKPIGSSQPREEVGRQAGEPGLVRRSRTEQRTSRVSVF